MSLTHCPLCSSLDVNREAMINASVFDHSTLYQDVRIYICQNCEHIFNQLNDEEYRGLIQYYNEEYSKINQANQSKDADIPGSSNPSTLKRFRDLWNTAEPFTALESKVLDIGCAQGGFLHFLHTKGFDSHNLYGIDITKEHIEKTSPFNLSLGSAEKIPHENQSFDLIFMDQVLEHVQYPFLVIQEIKRVLKPQGKLIIGVPNASLYAQYHFSEFFWLIMKEHIQHFTPHSVQYLATQENLQVLAFGESISPMMSPTMLLPNSIYVLGWQTNFPSIKLTSKHSNKEILNHYLSQEQEHLQTRLKDFKELHNFQKIAFWGIGREFLFLYSAINLKQYPLILIDKNPFKQSNLSVDQRPIYSPDILTTENVDIVFITAYAHKEKIILELREMGYAGQIL